MKNYNKVHVIEVDGIEFTVKEFSPKEPLIFLRLPSETEGHLFHRKGFDWYNTKYNDLSQEFKEDVYSAFETAQNYLDQCDNIFSENVSVKATYKEYF